MDPRIRGDDKKCYAKKVKKFFLIVGILAIFLPTTIFAATASQTDALYQINQKVCSRFEADVVKMAAIMEELRRRKGILETRVAFGGVDTPIENADYWITFAAEAVAYQKAQKYSSKVVLKNSLEVLKNKILKAKGEVGKALND